MWHWMLAQVQILRRRYRMGGVSRFVAEKGPALAVVEWTEFPRRRRAHPGRNYGFEFGTIFWRAARSRTGIGTRLNLTPLRHGAQQHTEQAAAGLVSCQKIFRHNERAVVRVVKGVLARWIHLMRRAWWITKGIVGIPRRDNGRIVSPRGTSTSQMFGISVPMIAKLGLSRTLSL